MAAKSTFNSSQNDVFGNMSDDDDDDDLNFNLDGSGFGSEDDEEDTNQQSSSMSDDLFDDDLPSSDEDADPYTDPNDIFNQMSDDDDDDDEDDEIQEPDEPPAPAPQPAPAPKKPAARHRGRPRKTQQEPVAPKQQAPIPTPQPAQSPQPADDYFNDNTDDMQSMQVIDDYQQQPDDAYYQNPQQQTMPTDDNNMQSYDYMAQQAQPQAQQAQPSNNNAYMQAQSQQAMYEQQYAQQDNNPFMQDTQQQSQVNHQPAHAQTPKPFAAPQEPAVSAWHGETPNPNMIQRIIAVSDSIRNDLSSDEKNAVRAVMNAKQISGDDLADLTYAVLTARKSTMTALEELLTARNKDIASRVFYLLRLNDDDLQTIYNIGIAFDAQKDTMSGSSLDHYAISEQANQAVSTLSDNSIDLLQAVYNIYNKSKALMNG